MAEVLDFLTNALPWIAIGLFVACSCVMVKTKTEGKEVSRFFKGMSWSPAVCFLFVAIMEMYSGNKSSGTTWLVLGVANAVVNFAKAEKQ